MREFVDARSERAPLGYRKFPIACEILLRVTPSTPLEGREICDSRVSVGGNQIAVYFTVAASDQVLIAGQICLIRCVRDAVRSIERMIAPPNS